MAPRNFTIEIRVDFDSDEKDETMKSLARMAAKHLLTQGLLLQDRRPPQVKLSGSDMFEAEQEISLADDIPQEAPADEGAPAEGAHSSNAKRARVAGYTVADKGSGWKFNDPDGKWSDLDFTTEAYAWEGAYEHSLAGVA